MKKILLNLKNVSLVLITGIFMVSCNKDETTFTDNIVGTWTSGTASVTAMAGTQFLGSYMTEYYIGTGLSEEEALTKAYNFEKGIREEFKGTLQINADSTCTCDMIELSLTEGSLWSLNPDRTELTIQCAPSPYDPDRVFYLTSDVLELTSSKLLLKLHRSIWLDNEQNIVNDLIPIEAIVNFTKQ